MEHKSQEYGGEDQHPLNSTTGGSLSEIWELLGGPQLQSLEIRNEGSVEGSPQEALSTEHLDGLSMAAPNLQSLTLQFERGNNTWPEAELAVIARQFPALESLTLYVELASECRQQIYYPLPGRFTAR